MIAGQQLIEEGRKQGIEQERQRATAMLLRLLRQCFGDSVQPHIEQRVATASSEQLELWLSRLFSGAMLDETFAG